MESPGSTLIEDSQSTSFKAVFYDGYSFKNLIEFLKRINPNATFEFHPDRIECFHYDTEAKNILTHVVVKSKNLLSYHLQSPDDLIRIGINLKDLQKLLKSIGKKDSLTMYKNPGEESIYTQIHNAVNKSAENNFTVFRPCRPETMNIEIPEYETSADFPSLAIPAANISSICSAMNHQKSPMIRVRVRESRLVIDNITQESSSGRVDSFPMHIYKDRSIEPYEIFIKGSTLKSLIRLQNLTPNGLVNIYTETDKPLLLVCKLNSFGRMYIYLTPMEQK